MSHQPSPAPWQLPPWLRLLKRYLHPRIVASILLTLVDSIGHVALWVGSAILKLSVQGVQQFQKINWKKLVASLRYFATHRQAIIPALLTATHDFRITLKYLRKHPEATPQYLAYLARQITPATWAGVGLATLGFIIALFLPILVTKYSPFAPSPELKFKRSWLSGYAVEATSHQGEITTKLGTTRDGLKLRVERGDYRLDFQMDTPGLDLTVDKGKATYQNTQQPIEIEYQLLGNGIKESVILRADPQTNQFTSTINTHGLIPYLTPEGQIVFYNQTGEYQFHFDTPYAFDSAGSTTYGVKYQIEPVADTDSSLVSPLVDKPDDNPYSTTSSVSLDKVTTALLGEKKSSFPTDQPDSTYKLTLIVDPLWLETPSRAYPITIDPTVIHDTTAEFATGQMNRVKDVGSGSAPQLETYYQELPADENTILLLHMNEATANTCSGGSNDVCDASGNSLDGAFGNNAAFNGSGILGSDAVTLDGTDDYVEVADNDKLSQWTNGFTMEGWFKPDTINTAGYTALMGKGTTSNWEYFLYFDITTGYVGCYTYTAAGSIIFQAQSSTQPSTGVWHHIACGFDASGMVLYVDGVEAGRDHSPAVGNVLTNGTGTFRIGMRPDNAVGEFDGTVDDVRLSNRLRTAEEIHLAASRRPYSVYTSDTIDLSANPLWATNGEVLTDNTSLIAQWNFNETSGTTLSSSAGTCGSNCTLTLNNFANTSGQDVAASSGWTSTNKRWGTGGLMFDGTDDRVSRGAIGTDFNFVDGDDFSYEGWIKTTKNGQLLFQLQSGTPLIYISVGPTTAGGNSNALVVYLRSDVADLAVISGTTQLTDNNWHHVAMTVDDVGATRTVTLYVDGRVDTTGTWSSTNATTLAASGMNFGTTPYDFQGVRDTTRFYRRTLTADEISANYQGGLSWLERGVATGDGETPKSNSQLVAQWNFNETSGTTADNAEGTAALDGTLTNFASTGSQDAAAGTGWTSANKRWGAGGLMFDGSNDYVRVTDTAALKPSTITLAAWFKTSAATGTLIGKYTSTPFPGYGLQIGAATANKLDCWVGGSSWTSSQTSVNDSEWHHGVCTYDGTSTRVYVDGVLEATTTQSGNLSGSTDLFIGSYITPSAYFSGVIDAVQIYSRALPHHEILSNYNTGTIELQARTSADGSTWGAWTPTTGETAVESFDTALTDVDTPTESWRKYNNAILSPSDTTGTDGRIPLGTNGTGDDTWTYDPEVILDNGTYKMWYTGSDGANRRIYYATSSDGLTWTKYNNAVPANSDTTSTDGRIPLGTTGTGDDVGTSDGAIIKDGSTYKMWYAGLDGSNWRIYYATSSDGLTWTKYNNAVPANSDTTSTDGRIPLGTAGTGDDVSAIGPVVIKDGSTYKMWYTGNDGSNYRIFYATSSDGLTWTKYNNTIPSASDTIGTDGRIPLGTTGTGDDSFTIHPVVYLHNGTYRMVYGGYSGSVIRIYSAISADGLTWKKLDNTEPNTSDTNAPTGRIPIGTSGTGDDGQIYPGSVTVSGDTATAWYFASDGSVYRTFRADMTTMTPIQSSSDTTIKLEGSGSDKLVTGQTKYDAHTVGLWRLDETNGDNGGVDLFDTTSANLDAEFNGTNLATGVVDGISGKARSFNGTDDYATMSVPSALNFTTTPFTVEAWVKLDSNSTSNTILTCSDGTGGWTFFTLDSGTGGVLRLITRGTTDTFTDSATAVPLHQWVHVAATFSGSNGMRKIYINGQLSGTEVYTGSMTTAAGGTCNFGKSAVSDINYMDGTIDEVKVSNLVRTDEEIAETYRLGRDTYLSKTISSTDLSGKTHLPVYVAADRPGTYLQANVSESAYATYQPDTNTVAQWHLDENVTAWGDTFTGSTINTAKWVEIDPAANKISQSNGLVLSAGAAAAWDSAVISQQTFPRTNGLRLTSRITAGSGHMMIGFANNQTSTATYTNINHALYLAAGALHIYQDGSPIAGPLLSGYSAGTDYDVRITLNSVGTQALYEIKGGAYTDWTIIYATDNAKTNSPVRIHVAQHQSTNTIRSIAVNNLNLPLRDTGTTLSDTHHLAHTTLSEGKLGKARYFDGASVIRIPEVPATDLGALTDNFTLETWFKTTTAMSAAGILVGKNDGSGGYSMMYMDTNESICMRVVAGVTTDACSATGLNDGNWHHAVGVRDATNDRILIYVDGRLHTSTTDGSTDSTSQNNDDWSIGNGGNYYTGNAFTGWIDEVRISNAARSATDIRQAFEYAKRTLPITIDFAANLNSGNLITNSSDLSFTVDATAYGLEDMGSMLFEEDKIIVRETVNDTEYIAQGDVTAVTTSTGAVTIDAWDSGSTFPTGGFTANATVFKWQREYIDLTGMTDDQINAVTNLTLRVTNGQEGRTIWLDDMKSTGGYLSNSLANTLTNTEQQYLQYRAIISSSDPAVSPWLEDVTFSYDTNFAPSPPTSLLAEGATNPTDVVDLTPELSAIYNDDNAADTAEYYEIEVNTHPNFDGTVMWDSGQTSMTSTAQGARSPDISYAGTVLTLDGDVYYWRIKFWDAQGAEGAWSTESATFTMANIAAPTSCTLERADDNSSITFNWNDPNTLETGYEIQRSTNGGAFAAWQTLAANSITQVDSAISTGDTYQYRVRAIHTIQNSAWCTTATLSPNVGNLGLEGVNLEGLTID